MIANAVMGAALFSQASPLYLHDVW
jgi:hypothetical protein